MTQKPKFKINFSNPSNDPEEIREILGYPKIFVDSIFIFFFF